MWPFRPALADEHLRHWIEDCYIWAAQNWGLPQLRRIPLHRPLGQSFDVRMTHDDAMAQALFQRTAHLLKIDLNGTQLAAEGALAHLGATDYNSLGVIAGTFQDDGAGGLIRCSPDLLHRPSGLISVLAHELMHLKLAPHINTIPGGERSHELATDLFCIVWGFGVFQIAEADDIGWAGYLSQPSRAYALALFLRITGQGPALAMNELVPRSQARLKRALDFLDREGLPEELASV
jgi:hypothetical protein